MDLYDELAWRGMVYDTTEGLREVIARETLTAYIGFDPTAASLHVGSLLPVMALARLQRCGHSPIALVGGGTGLIGDPSGKTLERSLLTPEQVDVNVRGIRAQLERFLDFDHGAHAARLVNNHEWLGELSALEFMRDVGKYFTVNYMLAKESVKRRVESEDGISYTEFSYLLLQSYDFLVLHDRFGCTLQMGGSDQWGNITAGLDLIRKLRGARAHGMVLPLVTSAAGTKFGKTEAGTVWLDPALTTPYEFYQFWFNADDRDAARYLKFFTFLDAPAVAALEAASAREPEKRHAQRELAREVTRLVHGTTAVQDAEAAADKLFRGDLSAMSVAELLQIFPNVPSCDLALVAAGWLVPELLTAAGVAASKSEAVRLVKGGGISLNGRRIADEKERITQAQAIEGRIFVIRKGKRDNFLVRLVGA
ncbi:MAG TPA: tyrosine--tRNA ligase [Vicinamibacterales bacterium]|nr:tyrosine--tRNA ligase [Vicinamibacterales bacterium]